MQLKSPGGIERFVSTLALMFYKGFEVEIIVNYGKNNESLSFNLPEGIKLTFLSSKQPEEVSMKNFIANLRWHKIPAELKRRANINFTRNRVFKNCLKNLQTDFIITDRAIYNSLVNKFYRGSAKKVATDHNFHQDNRKYIRELKKSLRNYDALVVATDELKNFYKNLFNLKCYSIPNPLPKIPTKKSKLDTKNLISVGRLVKEKDYELLINIMEEVHKKSPEIKLVLVGDGPEKEKLKKLISEKNLKSCIALAGVLPQEKIVKYYYNSSLFVMTSKTEAFGLALSEAMSYGLPCIALSRASGARAQIKNDTGILIENPSEMPDKIIETLNNKTQLKAYQNNINKYIDSYDKTNVLKSWQKVLTN